MPSRCRLRLLNVELNRPFFFLNKKLLTFTTSFFLKMIMSFNLNMKLRKRLIIWERDKKKLWRRRVLNPGPLSCKTPPPANGEPPISDRNRPPRATKQLCHREQEYGRNFATWGHAGGKKDGDDTNDIYQPDRIISWRLSPPGHSIALPINRQPRCIRRRNQTQHALLPIHHKRMEATKRKRQIYRPIFYVSHFSFFFLWVSQPTLTRFHVLTD